MQGHCQSFGEGYIVRMVLVDFSNQISGHFDWPAAVHRAGTSSWVSSALLALSSSGDLKTPWRIIRTVVKILKILAHTL